MPDLRGASDVSLLSLPQLATLVSVSAFHGLRVPALSCDARSLKIMDFVLYYSPVFKVNQNQMVAKNRSKKTRSYQIIVGKKRKIFHLTPKKRKCFLVKPETIPDGDASV